MAAWADDRQGRWKKLVFNQYGLHATLMVKTIRALYYKAGKDRLLVIVLVRDALGQRPDYETPGNLRRSLCPRRRHAAQRARGTTRARPVPSEEIL